MAPQNQKAPRETVINCLHFFARLYQLLLSLERTKEKYLTCHQKLMTSDVKAKIPNPRSNKLANKHTP